MADQGIPMEPLLAGLRAMAEPTRLRLLALCAQGELTVSELTGILGQSQPRVSRHLKLLGDAGLLDRFREGTWVFYRLALRGPGAELARLVLGRMALSERVLAGDRQRLEAIDQARAEAASAYFRDNAARWDVIRALHIDGAEVERALSALLPEQIEFLLDIGTGTGRLLQLFADRARFALGIDSSRDMLAVARANLAQAGLAQPGLGHCSVRHGDMYQLPVDSGTADLVVFHLVLHYALDPAAAIAEAARVLRPGGRMAIVDFQPHALEFLRSEHAHRRLGFSDREIGEMLAAAGLEPALPVRLPGDPLTVTIWLGRLPVLRPTLSSSTAPEVSR